MQKLSTSIRFVKLRTSSNLFGFLCVLYTRAKIDQVDATLFVEQRLNNVVIKVQQHLLNSQC